MIAAGKAGVHALLDYRPRAAEGEKEIMMVKLETVLNRVVVDFRSQPAEMNELLRTRAQWEFFSGGNNLTGCLARCGAFGPAMTKPKSFSRPRSPSFSAPQTVVVTPEECQSKP